ncbi:LysR family transcriptional regulator [Alteromonas sp. 5E99-2]|uniref:LysR family transcriptional regulator n=1 Tax=Alteromonas sp. 5E99-2 TaxID=2817683 RepID=UPI001A98F8B0|nr:LysR family transcriptional regulator [Alteromonas sp. 5E99-2]MBO1256878.1 LysR family transcriptional regulator [Alteromonas sp. 5E99-2]
MLVKDLDLKLLRVLHTLFEEQSVTSAARRLNLSQSAVSKHLARLRDMFDDPLFDRTAQGLKPTPRAIELFPQLRQLLSQFDQFARPSAFDPAVSDRRFRIDLLNTAYSLTFPHFMPDLLSKAPNVKLLTQTWEQHSLDKLLKCEIDIGIACREWDERSPLHMRYIPPDLYHTTLIREHSLCLVREDHPALNKPWNLDSFLYYRHIQVVMGGLEQWLLDDVLLEQNITRDIAIEMPDFHCAMSLCEQSDLILCAPARHANNMASHFKLRTLPMPIEFESGAYVMLWHKHFEKDLGHKWLRDLITQSVKQAIV